jgi:hypothetical protein
MNSIYIALWEYDIYFFTPFLLFSIIAMKNFIEQMSLQKKPWPGSDHSSRWLILTAKKLRYKESFLM